MDSVYTYTVAFRKAQRTAALQDAAGASADLQQQVEQLKSEAVQASKLLGKREGAESRSEELRACSRFLSYVLLSLRDPPRLGPVQVAKPEKQGRVGGSVEGGVGLRQI